MSKKSRSTSPPNGKTTEMNGASAADQVLFTGCRRTTQPHNCWIMSFDDPVQLDSESLSRLQHQRERSVWRGWGGFSAQGVCSWKRKWDETQTVQRAVLQKTSASVCRNGKKNKTKQNTRGIPKAEYGRAIKQSNVCASVNLLHAQLCFHTCESVTLCMCVVIWVWIYTVLSTTLDPTNPSPWTPIQSFLGMSRKELKWRHSGRSQGQFVEPRFNQRKTADNSRPDADFYYYYIFFHSILAKALTCCVD